MILVLLGTHPAPMDTVVEALDRLVDDETITDDVLIQAATFRRMPRHARTVTVVPYAELQRLISTADVVITHCGPATLADVRSAGRTPIVIARDPARGEHVDDHQQRYAARLRRVAGYIVVGSMDELAGAIAQARTAASSSQRRDVSRAVAALEAVLAARSGMRARWHR